MNGRSKYAPAHGFRTLLTTSITLNNKKELQQQQQKYHIRPKSQKGRKMRFASVVSANGL